MNKYEKILNNISDSTSVCIIGHIEPDTDALCSAMVLREFIMKQFGIKRVDIFAECESLSEIYLPIMENVKLNKAPHRYHTAIMIDCPNLDRIGKYKELFTNAKQTFVIDHHDTNNRDGDYNIVEIVSSTCEIVYKILKAYGYPLSDKNYGKIYAGLITDTNNFSVGAMTSNTFKIASACFDHIDQNAIYNHFFSNNTIRNMHLLALAIDNMITLEDGKIILTQITREQANLYKAKFDDYTGIINRLATIAGNCMVCFVQPKDDNYYVSMRAKRGFDVAVIAKKFGGGGHIGAAAYLSNKSIKEIEEEVLKEFLDQVHDKPLSHIKVF